jgi:hypothetical protein
VIINIGDDVLAVIKPNDAEIVVPIVEHPKIE